MSTADGTHLRRRVLDVSLAIVQEEGVAALSIREVARRAGVSHQAPYRHFADREEILATLAAEGFDALAAAMQAAAAAAEAAGFDALAAAGCAYVRWARANPGAYRLLFRPDLLARPHPDLAAAGARALGVLEGLVRARGGADTEVPVALAWSTVHGLAGLLIDGPLPLRGGSAARLEAEVPARLAAALGRAGHGGGATGEGVAGGAEPLLPPEEEAEPGE